jgi:hypothetical protein
MASAQTSTDSSSVSGPLPYRLTNDYLFRALLQKRRDILKGLLCALLSLRPEEIKDLNILNPIILGESISDKRPVLDISLCMNDNTLIDILDLCAMLTLSEELYGSREERSCLRFCPAVRRNDVGGTDNAG